MPPGIFGLKGRLIAAPGCSLFKQANKQKTRLLVLKVGGYSESTPCECVANMFLTCRNYSGGVWLEG